MTEENNTLLKMAIKNLKVKEAIEITYPDDDGFTNLMGYHLQQAIELALKHVLETHGIKYPKTHEILDLIVILPENYKDCTEAIKMRSREISHLEANTRYNKNYRASKELINDVSDLANKLIVNIKTIEKKETKQIEQQVKDNDKDFSNNFSR